MDVFSYISVFVSIIMSIGMAQILYGIATLLIERKRVKWYWLQIAWAIYVFQGLAWNWWMFFRWSSFESWNFYIFLFVALQPSTLYLLSVLVFPRMDGDGPIDLKQHYFENHRWFFSLLVLTAIIDFLDSTLKGLENLRSLGPSYIVFVLGIAGLYISGAVVRNEKYHAVLFPVVQIVATVVLVGYLLYLA